MFYCGLGYYTIRGILVASTNFVDKTTVIEATWLNAVNQHVFGVSRSTTLLTDTCTTVLPQDTSTPTASEGDEVLAVSHTPKAAGHVLEVEVSIPLVWGQSVSPAVVLFVNGTATVGQASISATGYLAVHFRYMHTAADVNPVSFSVRCGPATAGTVHINKTNAINPYMGSIGYALLSVKEWGA